MSELFLQILNMSITAGWVALGVVVLRLCFRRAPRWISVLLWAWWRCGCYYRFPSRVP